MLHEQTRWWTWETPVIRLVIVQAPCRLTDWLRFSARIADGSIESRFESLVRVPTSVGISVAAVRLSFVAPGAVFAWVED